MRGAIRRCLKSVGLSPFLLLSVLGGCSSGPPFEFKLIPDDATLMSASGVMPSLSVDLIPVHKNDRPMWDSVSVTAHFTPGTPENGRRLDLHNKGMLRNFKFSQSSTRPLYLLIDDAIWKSIDERGLEFMVLLADLPDPSPTSPWKDKPGREDPRRLILPIDGAHWNDESIEIEVQRSGLHLLTNMNPDE